VRQPIYKTSVQRWRHYEKHLGHLKSIGLQRLSNSIFLNSPENWPQCHLAVRQRENTNSIATLGKRRLNPFVLSVFRSSFDTPRLARHSGRTENVSKHFLDLIGVS